MQPLQPVPLLGLMTLQQRAYLLLSKATGGLGASDEDQARARVLWLRFIVKYPQFKSPLVSE